MPGVQAGFSYNPDLSEVPVRAWAEGLDGDLSADALDLAACSAELFDEAGALIASAFGALDPAGSEHALFRLSPIVLVAGQVYLLRVALRTSGGDLFGPRTFGMPVN